jgi:RNA polymerase sigma-70 factor (ECF subfamily)
LSEVWKTRQSLLMRAIDPTDERAWEDFVRYYERFIFHLLHRMNIRTDDFNSLVQEILIKLWKNLASYDREKAKFRTWLARVVRHAVYDYFRREKRLSSLMEKKQDIAMHLYDAPENDVEAMIEKEWIAHISGLAMERMKKVFSGKAVDVFTMSLSGVSTDEIAKRLDLKSATVYTLRNRVKARYIKEIRALMEHLEGYD